MTSTEAAAILGPDITAQISRLEAVLPAHKVAELADVLARAATAEPALSETA